MVKRLLLISSAILLFAVMPLQAAEQNSSQTVEAEGSSCIGKDKSLNDAEREAMASAKRQAVEFAKTSIESFTKVEDFELKKDLIKAYANGEVEILKVLKSETYQDALLGICYRVAIRAAVKAKDAPVSNDPQAPLKVDVWTGKPDYRTGEMMKVYLKGNKDFYAIVLYKNVKGVVRQILPNIHRRENYFKGGVTYEVPDGSDEFSLGVRPPVGAEEIAVHASTEPLGQISIKETGPIYEVQEQEADIGVKTRDIEIAKGKSGKKSGNPENFVKKIAVRTRE